MIEIASECIHGMNSKVATVATVLLWNALRRDKGSGVVTLHVKSLAVDKELLDSRSERILNSGGMMRQRVSRTHSEWSERLVQCRGF
jgi:hypothetical protein